MTGYIDFWKQDRGWGFVKTDGSDQKYFLHISAVLSGRPITGAPVTFDVGRTSKGLVAINAHIVPLAMPASAAAGLSGVQKGGDGGER